MTDKNSSQVNRQVGVNISPGQSIFRNESFAQKGVIKQRSVIQTFA
jgi:hypothetical protein